jgi:predicted NUDIX family NTP pyrophosphohydrolase
MEWITVQLARVKLLKGHVPFLDRLMDALAARLPAVHEG